MIPRQDWGIESVDEQFWEYLFRDLTLVAKLAGVGAGAGDCEARRGEESLDSVHCGGHD